MYQLASPVTKLRAPSECVRSRKLVINRVPSAIGVICVINYRVLRVKAPGAPHSVTGLASWYMGSGFFRWGVR